ncbi:MAG TPA: helix-turn-helix domain-containing protein [Chthoniobacterales bacterium]|jgi:transcriptional regulator with XRE-family HTH domain|nr:helix-turn-helix domain-containing protein [Chthoniobacterales bacterium]
MSASIKAEEANELYADATTGGYIATIREDAGMTQSQLAEAVTFSPATLSRIESGDKLASQEEVSSILAAIGTPKAGELAEFLNQNWDEIARPTFDHPNRSALWEANLTLRKVSELRSDPNLKAVFLRQVDLYEEELRRVTKLLITRDHQMAFIGSIGVGKSTAICKMTGLIRSEEPKFDRQIVLETGAGGITLCEVHIAQGPQYGIRIVPRSEESIRRDVEDFSEYLVAQGRPPSASAESNNEEETDTLGLSKEVVRAIRNMSGMTERRRELNGRRIRLDPAKQLAIHLGNAQELCVHILTKMDLLRRNRRDAWYPANHPHPPHAWLQEIFAAINNGRHPEFTLPQKIEIVLPESVLNSQEIAIRIVDTKGIDQTAERQDLECHFDDPRTLVVLCSRFNDAPEVALQTLLRRAKDSGARDVAPKTILLVLARPEEALAVKHDDGIAVEDEQEGFELKRDQIRLRLNQQGLADISVEFFNAREERPDALRELLVRKIEEHRSYFADRIKRLSEAVDNLSNNRQDEQIRFVFEHVMSDLSVWVRSNREIELSQEGVQRPLVAAIDGTRYASTIRAAVRRYGDWYNLDYYHHLAFGVRRLAVEQIGARIEAFKVIVNNLLANDELSPAKEFLEGVNRRLDVLLDESYRRIQSAGRETFIQTLAKHSAFWDRCDVRWGQGSGYRIAIRDLTDQELQKESTELENLLLSLLSAEWESIMTAIEGMLENTEARPSVGSSIRQE